MSKDLLIYTSVRQDFIQLQKVFSIEMKSDGFFMELDGSFIIVHNEIIAYEEDIPDYVYEKIPGLQFLIECTVTHNFSKSKLPSEFMRIARQLAINGHGIIYDPQNNKITLPSGITRIAKQPKKDRISAVKLSWWYNDNVLTDRDTIRSFFSLISKEIPEFLPKRYGLFEPPQEIYSDIDNFISFIMNASDEVIVWYPNKPVIDVDFTVRKKIGPDRKGYLFGYFSVEIDSSVYLSPGWPIAIRRVFRKVAEMINPFYADIRIINNLIPCRNGSLIDGKSESHPIVGPWWNGFPNSSGLVLVLGEPLLKYVNIVGNYKRLLNNCILIESNDNNDDLYNIIKIPQGLYQPIIQQKDNRYTQYGFSGLYPEIWPFKGPKSM